MSLSLANCVVLITGGSAGLGAATARAFAALGMRVVINYSNDSEKAESLLDDLRQDWHNQARDVQGSGEACRFLAIKADIASTGSAARLVDDTVSAMGQLDVVFSNHGWTRATNFFDLDENVADEDWDRCFSMNVKSHLHLIHAAKSHLEKAQGSFIFTSSTAGVRVSGSSLAYAVTKAAQVHLARCLAGIVAPSVRVNSVCPGMMITDWSSSFPTARKEAAIQKTKLKRLVTVEDVAQQVCTLARCPSVTGINVVMDAGAGL